MMKRAYDFARINGIYPLYSCVLYNVLFNIVTAISCRF